MVREKTMQAQTEKMKGALKGEFQAKQTTTTIKDVSPNGARVETNYVGEIKGEIDGRYMQTLSFLLKPDGNSDWESKSITNTTEGDMVVVLGNGETRVTNANTASAEGELRYMTTSPRLSWLNNATRRIEVEIDRTTGEYRGKAYEKN